MIDQIILPGLDVRRRAEIHSVFFAHVFDFFVFARESHDRWVEFGQVGFQHGWSVAGRVASDEDGENAVAGRGGGDDVEGAGEFV